MKRNVTDRNDADLLSARDAAQLLPATTPATLLRWGRQGRVPIVKLPGRVFFRRSDILELLKPVRSDSVQVEDDQLVLPFEEGRGSGGGAW